MNRHFHCKINIREAQECVSVICTIHVGLCRINICLCVWAGSLVVQTHREAWCYTLGFSGWCSDSNLCGVCTRVWMPVASKATILQVSMFILLFYNFISLLLIPVCDTREWTRDIYHVKKRGVLQLRKGGLLPERQIEEWCVRGVELDHNKVRRTGRESVNICQNEVVHRETLSSVSTH